MYDKDVLMLQVGGSQAFRRHTPLTVFTDDLNVFIDSCYQNGPQPLPHVDLVEIRALRLFQRELLQQRPGICFYNNTSGRNVPLPQKAFSDESELNLQDELLQWNRLTEEMLYLVIVIVGTGRSSRLTVWLRRESQDED